MDGHEPDGVHRSTPVAEQLVLRNPELISLAQLSVQQQMRSLGELAGDPRLVEPDGDKRTGVIEDARLHALLTPVAHRLDGNGTDRRRDGGVLSDREARDVLE